MKAPLPYETFIKRGDTPTKRWQASDDLSIATEVKIIAGVRGETPVIDREVDQVDGDIVYVTFTETETSEVANLDLEIQARFNSVAGPITYPERGYLKLYIVEDLG